jgi:hypothetical protein
MGPTGADGVKYAYPKVYQWALSTPSISGSTTFTWATATYTAPAGWTLTPGSPPGGGYNLYAATVSLIAAGATTTSTINWTGASILIEGYAGTNGATGATGATGAQARIMYARIGSNPVPVSGNVTVVGDNRPSSAQSSAVWGASFAVAWYATDPDPSSNNSLYQSDGIFDGTNSVWSTPYISSLKVGSLSAVSINTGALTVTDAITVATTGYIRGGQTGYATGTGFFLGYSAGAYKFSFGDATNSIKWDGTNLTVTGGTVTGAGFVTDTTGYVRGGQTGYDTGTGFFLGYSGTAYKFSIGNSTNSIKWDGANLTVTGGTITGSAFQTGTSGARFTLNASSDNALKGYDSSNNLRTEIYASLGYMVITNLGSTIAITGKSATGAGVFGESTAGGDGVYGKTTTGDGVFGEATGTSGIGVKGNATAASGVGVEGRSTSYFGGAFYGGTTSAPLYINASGSLPTTGAISGALCVVSNKLYFHNGTAWKEVQFV